MIPERPELRRSFFGVPGFAMNKAVRAVRKLKSKHSCHGTNEDPSERRRSRGNLRPVDESSPQLLRMGNKATIRREKSKVQRSEG